MKRTILLVLGALAALLISSSAEAGNRRSVDFDYFPRNEIYLQYGAPSVLELSTIRAERNLGTLNDVQLIGKSKNHKFSGAAAFGYSFMVNDRISVGLDFNYSYASTDIFVKDVKVMNSAVNAYTGTISGHYIYYQEDDIEISSGAYLGVCYKDEYLDLYPNDYIAQVKEQDRAKFAYHITAVKFRYGNIIGVIAELGFGFRGLVNVGLSIKI